VTLNFDLLTSHVVHPLLLTWATFYINFELAEAFPSWLRCRHETGRRTDW